VQEYVTFKLDDEINDVILITSTEDLYYIQDDIYDDLSITNGDKFTVLIDLFLRNGFSFNRFVSLSYEGKGQCRSFIINPREVSEEVKMIIKNYLKSHLEILENSALAKSAINFMAADGV
jgi:hypothetical protein